MKSFTLVAIASFIDAFSLHVSITDRFVLYSIQ